MALLNMVGSARELIKHVEADSHCVWGSVHCPCKKDNPNLISADLQ